MSKYDKCVQYILENQNNFYRIAYCHVHNEHDAQDIVQNAIIKALENIHTLRNSGAIRTWFYRVLVNECLSFISRNKREIPFENSEIFDREYTESFYDPHDEILANIFRLSTDNKVVILLHIYEQLTLKEISAILGIPLSTVKSRYYSAIEQLKKQLTDEGHSTNIA